eukprot:TRINITY_DN1869_c0_g1_i1.p1 TRINITY_DN1869_c0_g1~~TRINITY_DN1869_c0_g1_i1.p1  ORF type:complete len:772 (+),score=130.08 TRINITY_DN1869_c0_g1_i1:71-2317(+)
MDFPDTIPNSKISPNQLGWAETPKAPTWTDKVMASHIPRQVNPTDSPLVNPSANNSAFFLPPLDEEDRHSVPPANPLIDAIDKLLHANNQQAISAASARVTLPATRSWQQVPSQRSNDRAPKHGPAYYMGLGQPAPQRERARSSPDPATLQFLEKEGLIFRQEAVNVPLTQSHPFSAPDRSRASSAAAKIQASKPFHHRIGKTISRSSTVDTLEIPSPAESSLGPASEFNDEEIFESADNSTFNDLLTRLAGTTMDTSSLLSFWGTQGKAHLPQPLTLPASRLDDGLPSPTNSDEPRKLNPAAKPWSPPAKTESPPPAPVRVREPTRITNLRKRLQRMEQTKQRLAEGMTVDRRQMAALEHEAEVRYEISQWELHGILLRDEETTQTIPNEVAHPQQAMQATWPSNANEWLPNRAALQKSPAPRDWFELLGQSVPTNIPRPAQAQPTAPQLQRQLLTDLLLKTLAQHPPSPKLQAPQAPIQPQAVSPPSPSPAPVPVETIPSPIISPQLLERLLAVLEQPPAAVPVLETAQQKTNLPSPAIRPALVPLVPAEIVKMEKDEIAIEEPVEDTPEMHEDIEEEEGTAVPEQPETQEDTSITDTHTIETTAQVTEDKPTEEVDVTGSGEEENHATAEDESPDGDAAELQCTANEEPAEAAQVLSTPLMEATSVTEPIASGNPQNEVPTAEPLQTNAEVPCASSCPETSSFGSGPWKPLHVAPFFDLWRAIGALSLLVIPFVVIIMLFAEATQ